MLDTAEKNKLKPDTILKNFWRDNRHFADLFNAVFFNGEQVLKPQDLTEADRKSTRLNSSHIEESRMPSSA